MRLTEAIEFPLFESFGDLNRIIRSTHNEIFNGGAYNVNNMTVDDPVIADNIEDYYNEVLDNARELSSFAKNSQAIPSQREIRTSQGLANFLRYLMKHPVIQNNFTLEKDTGWWIRMLRSQEAPDAFLDFVARMYSLSNEVLRFESDPERVKPDMDVITKKEEFEVYRINNYAAARKICTTFKTNFCIGANPEMFNAYGEMGSGRTTYAITLPNRKVVIVHHGDRVGYIITSNDNNSDVTHKNLDGGRGNGILGVFDDFNSAGLDVDDMGYALSFIMTPPEVREIVNKVDDLTGRGRTPSPSRGEFEDDPFDDWDADEILDLFNNPRNR